MTDIRLKRGSLINLSSQECQDGIVYFAQDDNFENNGKIFYDLENGTRVNASGVGYDVSSETSEIIGAEIFNDYRKGENVGNVAEGNYSHAEGRATKALGNNTHAQGDMTQAIGQSSNAEGCKTISYGNRSHAEGYSDYAKSNQSVDNWRFTSIKDILERIAVDLQINLESNLTILDIENLIIQTIQNMPSFQVMVRKKIFKKLQKEEDNQNKTEDELMEEINEIFNDEENEDGLIKQSENKKELLIKEKILQVRNEYKFNMSYGQNSHTEGLNNLTLGDNSHAEGNFTTAVGKNASAKGSQTLAVGDYSNASGYSHIPASEVSITYRNEATGEDITELIPTIEIETNEGKRPPLVENAVKIKAIYDEWIRREKLEDGTVIKYGVALGNGAHTEGKDTLALEANTHAEGVENIAMGKHTHAEGNRTLAYGHSSHSEGNRGIAYGKASHVEGRSSNTFYGIFDTLDEADNPPDDGITRFDKIYEQWKTSNFNSVPVEDDEVENETDDNDSSTLKNFMLAYGKYSHAEGSNCLAWGDKSHVEGDRNLAKGNSSHAEGRLTEALGDYSHTEGHATTAVGKGSHAAGNRTTARGNFCYAEGFSHHNALDIKVNRTNDDGDGTTIYTIRTLEGLITDDQTDEQQKKNKYTIEAIVDTWKNPSEYNDEQEENVDAKRFSLAFGEGAHSEGLNTLALHTYSHAEGYQTISSGKYAHAEGFQTEASGKNAHAEGENTLASGDNSFASGLNNTSKHKNSFVIGEGNTSHCDNQFTCGKYSETHEKSPFVVGWGENKDARATIFRVSKIGNVYSTGSFNPDNEQADFAEYFEWEDGNYFEEDRRGLFVTLKNNKIIKASRLDDYILGVVSSNPGIICNGAENNWHNKYQKDSFGTLLSDENGNLILNENFNPNLDYIPRSERSEWTPVGLTGQLIVVDDGTCYPNGFCYPLVDGVASNFDENSIDSEIPYYLKDFFIQNKGYRVLERIDSNHIKILVK